MDSRRFIIELYKEIIITLRYGILISGTLAALAILVLNLAMIMSSCSSIFAASWGLAGWKQQKNGLSTYQYTKKTLKITDIIEDVSLKTRLIQKIKYLEIAKSFWLCPLVFIVNQELTVPEILDKTSFFAASSGFFMQIFQKLMDETDRLMDEIWFLEF